MNHHNDHPAFEADIASARNDDGRFYGVNRVMRLDSAVSKLRQPADAMAYSRTWIRIPPVTAAYRDGVEPAL